MMKNWWIKFGCFLTGYNYDIVCQSSEATAKAVKKYTSALLIVSLIWGAIGYTFSERYLHLDTLGAIIGAIAMVVIVIQIERQIILSVGVNRTAKVFRMLIAVIMAILGSIIIDQIIFKEDIALKKEESINQRISEILPEKIKEINLETQRLDSLIALKDAERILLIEEVTKTPIINLPGYETIKKPGKVKRTIVENGVSKIIEADTIYTERKYSSSSKENPKAALIPTLDLRIKELSEQRDQMQIKILEMRSTLEEKYRNTDGFLDEINLMLEILLASPVALFVWFLWFAFLCFIELFIVTSKMGKDSETDYDKTVKHQRDTRIKALNKLLD